MKHFTLIMYLLLSTVLFLLTAVFALPLGNAQASPQPDATTTFDCTQVSEIPQVECEALVAFYNATDGPNWSEQYDWLATNTPCTWHGITCSNGHVSQLAPTSGNPFYGNGLSGAIPPEIGNLSSLTLLDLSHNQLTAVPPEIGNLSSVEELYLWSNQLTAAPPEIGNLSNLRNLRLDYNQLTAVPPEIGNLSSLTDLYLAGNQLTVIPPEIGNLSSLAELNLGDNQLTAVLPEIWNLNNLKGLYLYNNQLTAVPPEIDHLSRLTSLFLDGNQLTAVPPEIWNLSSLTRLRLDNNQLTAVPPEISNLGNLTYLNLGGNQLTAVAPEIGNLANLTWLDLYNNQLTAIPPEIGNLSSLTRLGLENNQLTAVPTEIGNLTNLTYLSLNDNPLNGTLPDFLTSLEQLDTFYFFNTEWCAPAFGPTADWLSGISDVQGTGVICSQFTGCTDVTGIPQVECEALAAFYNATDGPNWAVQTDWLATNTPCAWYGITCSNGHVSRLALDRNDLSGGVPPEIGNLGSLEWLGLWNNQLTAVPPQIGNLSGLAVLSLGANQLTSIPPEIGNLSSLTGLYLSDNKLTAVPSTVGNLSSLEWLDLYNNQLTAVPSTVGNLGNLTYFSLSVNQLTAVPPEIGNLSSLARLDLGGNQLTAVPPEIGNLSSLRLLFLNNNQLAAIPSTIGNLSRLTILDLPGNQLTAVPLEIGNLSNLTRLDLGGNQLTAVPPEIGNLSSLTGLYLHNNQLTAVLPEIGNLSSLTGLYLHNNLLSGLLPGFLTSLNLDHFTFHATSWCVPDDPTIENWLETIPNLAGTGYICGQPLGGLSGVVTDRLGDSVANAQVLLYRTAAWYSPLVASTNTDESGQYSFGDLGQGIDYFLHFQDGTGAMAPEYHENKDTLGTADPITATLGFTRTINAQLNIAQPPLVTVGLGSGSATSSVNPLDGTVHINVPPGGAAALTLTFAAACEDDSVPSAVVLSYNGQPYPMTASGSSYQATIPAANVTASAPLTITTTCNGTDNPVTVGTITLYDPSGTITDASTQQPVVGAKVTLYQVPGWLPRTGPNDTRPSTCESNTSKPAGVPWSQPAPTDQGILVNTQLTQIAPLVGHQYTNDAGYYGWDVPEGCWYVIVEAEGYEKLVSPVVGVPPAVLDLDLALTPTMQFVYLPMIMRP